MSAVELTGNDLTLAQLYDVVYGTAEVRLAAEALRRMEASRAVVERVLAAPNGRAVYGVNTGFGELSTVRISADQLRELQLNLVRSHACGVGAPLPEAAVRAMLLLRANALAKGLSGVRPAVAETLCAMLNAGVHPVVPSRGSAGASGDLAPLAHLALVAIGEGEAVHGVARVPGAEAMRRAKIASLVLEAKEGLALLNGTQAMQAVLAIALRDADILADTADVAAALSLDALRGSPAAFDARITAARPFPGAARVARNLERLNAGSAIRESHRAAEVDPRVQDAYSLRCIPQVHGAVRDALENARGVLEIEINSATDNPLVFAQSGAEGGAADAGGAGEVISGGNFHGQPLAMAADQMAVALATLAGISERRTEHLTNPHTSLLPAFLTRQAGLNSGFMILQVAAAALTAELRAMAAPHSIHSLPTSANQEDFVSMGMGAALRLGPMVEGVRQVIAIELLAAAQGIDFLAPLTTGAEAQKAHALVRSVSAFVERDRSLSADIEAVARLIAGNEFARLLG
jgi:histidine ammonia-lyase